MQVHQLFDLTGRVALVTGGSRGLGLEIAEGLGEAGAKVVICARREEWLGPAAEHLRGLGIESLAVPCDVSRPDQVEALVTRAVEHFGRLDILVNAAGRSWGQPAVEMPLERWREVMEANATGTFLVCQAASKVMIPQGYGRIINIASVAGLVGTPPEVLDAVGYTASKGAIVALTRDLAVKWARYGITVNAIAPGFFPTRMSSAVIARAGEELTRRIPMGRVGREGELKGVAVFLASEAASYVTGQVLCVDGGMTAV